MFETIVFVAICVAATGMLLALVPPRGVYARKPVALVAAILAAGGPAGGLLRARLPSRSSC